MTLDLLARLGRGTLPPWPDAMSELIKDAYFIPRSADGDDVSSIVSAAATASQTADTILMVPKGTFYMDPVTIGAAGSYTTLHTYGEFYDGHPSATSVPGSRLKLKAGSNATMFTVAAGDSNGVGPAPPVFEDVTLDGNRSNQSSGSIYLIDHPGHTLSSDKQRGSFIRRCFLTEARTSGLRAGQIRNAGLVEDTLILNCGNGSTGSALQWGACSDWRLTNCDFGVTLGPAVQDSGADSIFFTSCNFFSAGTHGYKADSAAGSHYFTNCSFDRNQRDGVLLGSNTDAVWAFTNCRFTINSQAANNTYADLELGANHTKVSLMNCDHATGSVSNFPKYLFQLASTSKLQRLGGDIESGSYGTSIWNGSGSFFSMAMGATPQFGTYTSGAATDSTGYISIIDEAGNARKLMVQA